MNRQELCHKIVIRQGQVTARKGVWDRLRVYILQTKRKKPRLGFLPSADRCAFEKIQSFQCGTLSLFLFSQEQWDGPI